MARTANKRRDNFFFRMSIDCEITLQHFFYSLVCIQIKPPRHDTKDLMELANLNVRRKYRADQKP